MTYDIIPKHAIPISKGIHSLKYLLVSVWSLLDALNLVLAS